MDQTSKQVITQIHNGASNSDGRSEKRKRVIKRGVVSIDNNAVTHYCVVKDFSSYGARLIFDGPVILPERFWLNVEVDGVKVECQKKWRNGFVLGAEFLGIPIEAAAKRPQVVKTIM